MSMRKAVAILAVCAAVASCGRRNGGQPEVGQPKMISENRAVQIARKEYEGNIDIPPDCPIKVRIENGQYVVTFVLATPRPMPMPDYYAEVRIDAYTGEVIDVLVGS